MADITISDQVANEDEWTGPYLIRLAHDDDPDETLILQTQALLPGERFGRLEEDQVIVRGRALVDAIADAVDGSAGIDETLIALAGSLGDALASEQPPQWLFTTTDEERIVGTERVWIQKEG